MIICSLILVVTGSTDGIGQAYALELARQGFDIVLVSRTQSKLDTTAAEIRRKHGVKVESVAFDFKAGELDVYERGLLSKLRKYEIGVLSTFYAPQLPLFLLL